MRTFRTWPVVAPLAVVALLPLHARALQPLIRQSPRASGQSVQELLTQVGSPDWNQRTSASTQLAAHKDATLDVLLAAVGKSEAAPEQHVRLTRLAWERFSATPRGALGISFQWGFVGGMQSGAVIEGTFEGFDSHRALKAGDTIYSMDEVRIHSIEDGMRVIQSHDPGERVTLRIFREGQPIIVRVTLGSLFDLKTKGQNLGQQRRIEPGIVRDAFRIRLERSMGQSGLKTPIDLTRFSQEERPPQAVVAVQSDTDQVEPPAAISAGGLQGTIVEGQFDHFVSNPQDLQIRVSSIMRQLQDLDGRLQMVSQQLADPNILADRRQRAERDQRILLEKRAKLKLELSGLQTDRVLKP
jgi:hypothetical protein